MNGSGRHSQGSGGAGASVESILNAIQFQSAILTLNSAVEAAHIAGPTAPTSRAPGLVERAAGKEDGNRREARPAPSQVAGLPEAPGGSAPLPGCAASAADCGAEARWQRSLERLQQSLAAACGADRSNGADDRRQTGTAPPRATAAPDAVPILRRRRRSTPAQFGPPHPFQGGTS